jgi:uncharacterized membrane protein
VIESAWLYLAMMLGAAGLFPFLQARLRWRLFEFMPAIVLTYLVVMALAVAGAWARSDEIALLQTTLVRCLLPALLFLLMATCDLRAILALGPRVLAVFFCALLSILVALALVYLLFRSVLPDDGALIFAALSATWVGGTANLLAVKQSIGLSESSLSPALLTDAVCYSVWVVALFSLGPLVARFNRWARVREEAIPTAVVAQTRSADGPMVLLWLGIALSIAVAAHAAAPRMPSTSFMTATTWAVLIATVLGLLVARTPLGRMPGPPAIASALLALLVATMASQSSFAGLASAPMMIACGFLVLALHAGLLALAARAFRFDLRLCTIASLAQIGGVASAPILAATYSPALVPVAVLMAMLGYILGTGVGLMMAQLLGALAPLTT